MATRETTRGNGERRLEVLELEFAAKAPTASLAELRQLLVEMRAAREALQRPNETGVSPGPQR